MDRLQDTEFLRELQAAGGGIFLTHYQAMQALAPELLQD
jgi:hypothetical protein